MTGCRPARQDPADDLPFEAPPSAGEPNMSQGDIDVLMKPRKGGAMSSVRKFTLENRLAKAFGYPNGLLLRQALQRAEVNLEKVRDAHLAALDDKLAALRTVESGGRYRPAQDILSDAGTLGLRDISRAALSLWYLLALPASGRGRDEAIAVHMAALLALRESQGTAAQTPRPSCVASQRFLKKAAADSS